MSGAPARGADVLQTPAEPGATTVVVVTFNSATTIEACVRSVLRTSDAEVVVVDNASRDGTVGLVARLVEEDPGRVTLVRNDDNLGFSEACNVGIRLGRGEAFVLLNPDTVVRTGWLEELRGAVRHADGVGAVGPISNYVAGQQQVGLWLVPDAFGGHEDLARSARERFGGTSLPTRLLIGFCLLLPRGTLERVGGLDPELFLGNDDLDLSWRLRLAGLELRVAPGAYVEHVGQVSFDTEPRAHVERLVQESTDALAGKLAAAYGDGAVPRPQELWGIDWFRPSREPWS